MISVVRKIVDQIEKTTFRAAGDHFEPNSGWGQNVLLRVTSAIPYMIACRLKDRQGVPRNDITHKNSQ